MGRAVDGMGPIWTMTASDLDDEDVRGSHTSSYEL